MSDDGQTRGESPASPEGRLDDFIESVSDAFYAVDPEWRIVVFNRAAEEFFGFKRDAVLGRSIWEIWPAGRDTEFGRACERAMSEGLGAHMEAPSAFRPGRTVELRITPLRAGGASVALTDVTERARIQAQLREAEEDYRHAAELNPQVAWTAQPDGQLDRVAARWREWTGTTGLGSSYADALHPDDVQRTFDVWGRSVATGEPYDILHRVRRTTGEHRWIRSRAYPRRDEHGAIIRWYGSTEDVHEQKLAEEHLRLMVLELNHRVKNNLATVQAIAVQTLRGTEAPEAAREAFLQRITALAAAHDILTREQWDGVGVADIAEGVLRALDGAADRVRLVGPDIRLAPKTALALSMAFHELGTNALKYGALSAPAGQVRLDWRVEDAAGPTLALQWAESGGPAVAAPKRRGFGSRLLERGLASELRGEVEVLYEPAGVRCTIRTPLEAPAA
ncbi:sensor histidine kinase [Phenylobacterium sp. VNQ135]|uniref:sensor histidine kinase n=1 Tax=Phenylobacterium sp. VNQ135 TaxID=3400922 RepID=UPI003C11B3E4